MEKKHRFALRKTTMGLVSAMILGVTISPIFGTGVMSASAAEEKADEESEIMLINAELDDSDLEYVRWTANPIRQIEEEIARQLATNKSREMDEDELDDYEIRWGDTVWGITQAHDLDMDQFVEVNNIDNPDLIYAGDIVTLDTSAKKESEVSNEVDSANDAETESTDESVENDTKTSQTEDKASNTKDASEDVETNNKDKEDEVKEEETKDESNSSATDTNRTPGANEIVSGNDKEEQKEEDNSEKDEPDSEKETETGNEEETPENDDKDKDENPEDKEEDKEDKEEEVDSETEEDTGDVEIPEDETEKEEEDFDEDIIEDEKEENDNNESDDEDEKEEEDEEEKDVIRKQTVERKFTIKHGTTYKEDDTLPKGEEKVVQDGKNGQRVETYERIYINDKLDSETLLSDEVREEAVDKIVHIGTQTTDIKRDTVVETNHHDTVYKETDSLYVGEEETEQKAVPTKVEKVYETKIVNGVEQERKLIDEKVVQEGQPKIVLVGTKERFDINSYEIDAELLNQEMLKIVNEFRADVGVNPLIYDAELQEGANVRAKDLLEMEQIDHARPDGSDWRSAFDYLDYDPAYALGENIAMNFVSLDVVDQVENGEITFEAYLADEFAWQFYRSEGHYQNMINPDYNKFATQSIVHPETGNKMFNAMILSTRD